MSSAILKDFGDQLAHLHPGLTIVVPNELLLSWFPPAPTSPVIDERSKSAAQAFASAHGCAFHYFPIGGDCEQGDGRFHKPEIAHRQDSQGASASSADH